MTVSLKGRFVRLARYNGRANAEMYEALSRVTDRARRRETGSWFGSIHGLLNHVIVCEIAWLRRYRAMAPDSPALTDPCLDPPNLMWDHDLHEDFDELASHQAAVDAAARAWFAELPESRYGEIFEYQDSSGSLHDVVACDAFDFLLVHNTHHRGQVSQILDTLGVANNFADNKRFLSRDADFSGGSGRDRSDQEEGRQI